MEDIREKFKTHIELNNLKSMEIAASANISRSHLSRILNCKREISKGLKNKLNSILNTDY